MARHQVAAPLANAVDLRYGDDRVTVRRCLSGLLGEARAEFGRRILASHHEQVVKSADGTSATGCWSTALVESVKQVGTWSAGQQTPAGVRRQLFSE